MEKTNSLYCQHVSRFLHENQDKIISALTERSRDFDLSWEEKIRFSAQRQAMLDHPEKEFDYQGPECDLCLDPALSKNYIIDTGKKHLEKFLDHYDNGSIRFLVDRLSLGKLRKKFYSIDFSREKKQFLNDIRVQDLKESPNPELRLFSTYRVFGRTSTLTSEYLTINSAGLFVLYHAFDDVLEDANG